MFNEYPYRNLTDVNLDFILKHIKNLETNLQDFIKLNTIKYADPIDWNISKQYEANTVVVNEFTGVAYLSTQPVPAGVDVTNSDYWTPIFTLDFVNLNKNITLRNDGNNNNATFASVTGDWLIVGGQLYKVIQDISLHTAYVVDYNIQIYSVELFVHDYLNHVVNLIGMLDDLTTSDKTSIVNAINSVVEEIGDLQELTTSDKTSVVNAINSLMAITSDTVYITPEDYGAVGDGVTDDTQAFKDTINAGTTDKINIVLKSKNYLITDDLEFAGIYIYGNNANIITTHKISLTGYSLLRDLKVTGGQIECKNGHNYLNNVLCEDFNGTAFIFDSTDFETLAYGLRYATHSHATNTIGLHIKGSDTTVKSVYGYGAVTGIKFDSGNNYVSDAHLWTLSYQFDNSVFVSGGTNNHVVDSCCDTFQYIFEPAFNSAILYIDSLNWINNNVQVNNKTFHILKGSYTARLIGNVSFGLSGFNTSSNKLDLSNGTDYLNMYFRDAGGGLLNTFRVYYDALISALGLPADTTGSGSVGYMNCLLDANMSFYFYAKPVTTITSINLNDYFEMPATIERQLMICQASYKINNVNTKSYVYVTIERNGQLSFTKPTEVGNNPFVEINVNFLRRVKF